MRQRQRQVNAGVRYCSAKEGARLADSGESLRELSRQTANDTANALHAVLFVNLLSIEQVLSLLRLHFTYSPSSHSHLPKMTLKLLSALLAVTSSPALSFVLYPEAFVSPSVDQPQVAPAVLGSNDDVPATPSSDLDDTPLPLVIWHGLGDQFNNDGLKDVAKLAEEVNPGTYVHIISLAETGDSDRTATFFGNVTEQIEYVCRQLASDNILRTAPAIDAIGFSQGGQFMRGYVERCNNPPVRNLVTFGAQHNGIAEFQKCKSATDLVCQGANALLRSGTWSNFVQSRLVPAQYFRNPNELDAYLESSNFLADINSERALKNKTYKENLISLNKFVMYLFRDDTTVIPKETGWFAEVNTTSQNVTYLKDRPIYKEDWLGLKTLDKKGGLIFEEIEGGHMQLSEKLLTHVMKTYFGPANTSTSTGSDGRGRLEDRFQIEL